MFKVPAATTEHHRPSEFRAALSCLCHPWSLLALAVLAFNDHWWKGVGPGALTGKLSDLAGLFYFPFLVVAAVAWLARERRHHRLVIGKFVFVGVGAWFATAKTIPVIHSFTVDVATFFVGDVQVVRDPSDALAVVMLIPAWLLYRRIAESPERSLSRIVKVPAVCAAVVLTTATSKPPEPGVTKLIVHKGALHAVVPGDNRMFSTKDGTTWVETDGIDSARIAKHTQQQLLRLPSGEELRLETYAVSGKRGSGDWQRQWGISADRREYMRIAGATKWRTMDIALLPNSSGVVVVALGTEGVVIRDARGTWHRRAVGPIRPTPAKASIFEATKMVASSQWFAGLAGALLAWSLLSWLTWCRRESSLPSARAVAGERSVAGRMKNYVLAPFRAVASVRLLAVPWLFAALGGLSALLLLGFSLNTDNYSGINFTLQVLGALMLSIWCIMAIGGGWQHHKRTSDTAVEHTYDHIEESMLCGVATLLPLGLWDVGVIAALDMALTLATASLVASMVFFAGRIYRTRDH